MNNINRHLLCQQKMVATMCFLILPLLLTFLAGCVAGGKIVPIEPVAMAPPVPEGPTVTSFDDGRRGFIITEVANLDENVRRDFDQAVVHLHNHEFDPAIELLETVAQTAPGVSAPYINLALAYRKVDKSELAEENLKTALELIPGHPVASNEYGLLLRKAGRFVEARNVYEQSLLKFPDYLPLHRNLGILCDIYLSDPECALSQYELYSESSLENQQVKVWISELRMRLGR